MLKLKPPLPRSGLALLALIGCAKADDTAELVCGEGTVKWEGECVSIYDPPATTDPTDTEQDLECGEGTEEIDGECVSTTEEIDCGEGTVLVDGECLPEEEKPAPELLVPGHYTPPLTQMQRLESEVGHMHIYTIRYRETDEKVFYCSYTFGVLDASDPYDLDYAAEDLKADNLQRQGERSPGCLHLDWHDEIPDYVFTTHRENIDFASYLGAWVLQMDPEDPQEVEPYLIDFPLQEEGVSYEGLDYEDGYIYVAIHEGGLAVYTFDGATFTRVTELEEFDNAWDVTVRGDVAYVSDGVAGVVTVDISDPELPFVMGRVATNGQALDIELNGDIAYVAAGAGGVAVLDVSDPYYPTLVNTV